MLSSLNPYSLVTNKNDGTYAFRTDAGTIYVISLDDASCYVENIPDAFRINEFGFYPQGFTTAFSSPNYSRIKPNRDLRIKDTIQFFLLEYLKDNRHSLLVSYETLDSKHEGRFRLFDNWFKSINSNVLEKHDKRIQVEGAKYPSLGSLIIHKNNEYKEAILKMVESTILIKNGYN